MLPFESNIDLFCKIESENLLQNLIEQLNKDFALANVNVKFSSTDFVIELKGSLNEVLINLFTNKYDDYLNLLYRIDISEKDLLQIKENNLNNKINEVSILVIKREFQKVWFKSKYL